MQETSFTITVTRERRLVQIAFEPSLWDDETKRRFIGACIASIMSLGCPVGTQRILVDLRNAVLQSQGLIATMQKFLAHPEGGRVALVAEAPLARMQTRRLQVRDDVRLFADMQSAHSWLFSNETVRAA